MKKTLLLTGIAALAAAPLIAQEMKGHEGHGMMAREPMTRTDVQTRVKTHFAEMDTNKDGSISRTEFDAHHAGMMQDGPRGMGVRHGMKHGGGHGEMGRMGGRMFGMADTNKDGKVTEAEATASALAHFDMIDADKNGTISDAEHQAAREKMRAEWKAKKSS